MFRLTLMKLAMAACVAVAGIQTAAAAGAHLFILSGQSNMNILYAPSFTANLSRVLPPEDIILVKDAEGGAPILRWYKDWQKSPDAPHGPIVVPEWNGIQGDLYDRLMAKVDTAIAGRTLATVTFLWLQGEEDANTNIHGGAVYEQSLHGLIDQLKTDLNYPNLNVVIGRINDAGLLDPSRVVMMPDCQEVRDAQVRVAESSPRYTWIDTDQFNGPNHGLHNIGIGLTYLVQMFTDKALELVRRDMGDTTIYTYLTITDTNVMYYGKSDAEAESVFTDDFSDSNFNADPALAGGITKGLGWEQPDQAADFTLQPDTLQSDRSLALVCPYNSTAAKSKDFFIRALPGNSGTTWKNYAVDYRVHDSDMRSDMGAGGLMLLMNGYGDYYLFSTTYGHAVLYRVMSDSTGSTVTSTPLFACTILQTIRWSTRYYRVVAEPGPDGISFYFGCSPDSAGARAVTRVCIDTDPAAIARFGDGGGIGFFKNYPTLTGHQLFDDISVKVFSFKNDTVATSVRTAPATVPRFSLSTRIVTDRLTVRTGIDAAVTVFDAAGNPVADGRGGRFVWAATGAAAGTYFVQISDGNGRTVERVLKTE